VIVMNAGGIAQDGTPRSLYATPANRFIADFIGEANIVPVTVRRMDDTRAEVTLGALRLVMPHASLADGGMADGAALLAIRPHAIRLSATASTGGLAGSVAKAAYLGSHMEYDIEIDGQETRLFVIAGDVDAPLAVGTRIRASMDPAGLALIPPD
jgi:iron(III) transport system ATP-binding protein